MRLSLFLLAFTCAACSNTAPADTGPARSDAASEDVGVAGDLGVVGDLGLVGDLGAAPEPAPAILSAFYGLDDALPMMAGLLCAMAPGKDGLPVVLSVQIDMATLDAADFQLTTRSGAAKTPVCALLAPANETDELRTVLLIGDLGSAADPPVRVEIVGELASVRGTALRGVSTTDVTPLEDGPSIVLAERPSTPDPELGRAGRGGGCPRGTPQVVTITWEGGVTLPGGGDPGDAERAAYTVELEGGATVNPTSFADAIDNDNVQDLCLDTPTRALRVRVNAGLVVDPRGDPNPATEIPVP